MTKKRWKCLVGIQAGILFFLILILAFPMVNKTFYANDLICELGKTDDKAVYADEDTDLGGWFVKTGKVRLGYGIYKVTVEYESTADSSFLYFTSEKEFATEIDNIDKFYSDVAYLTKDYNTVTTDVYINLKSDDYYMGCVFGGEGMLTIKSISIHKGIGGVLKGIIVYVNAVECYV